MSIKSKKFQIPPPSNTELQLLETGVSFQWVHHQGITIYNLSITDVSRKNVDVMIDTTIELLKTNPHFQSHYFLIELTCLTGITPYFKSRLEDLKDILIEIEATSRTAVLIPCGFVATIFQTFSRIFNRQMPAKSVNEMFQDRDEALKWLTAVTGE